MLRLEEIANHLETIRKVLARVRVSDAESVGFVEAIDLDLQDHIRELKSIARPCEAGLKLRQLIEMTMKKPDDF